MPNLSSAFHLFFNPIQIQIRTEFMYGSQFITVTGPTRFFFLPFSLSLSPPVLRLCFLASLSLAFGQTLTAPFFSLHYSWPNPPHQSSTIWTHCIFLEDTVNITQATTKATSVIYKLNHKTRERGKARARD
jgi:hypothetical protein